MTPTKIYVDVEDLLRFCIWESFAQVKRISYWRDLTLVEIKQGNAELAGAWARNAAYLARKGLR